MVDPSPDSFEKQNQEQKTLTDLTWEEKEKVLRALFAKMNGTSLSKCAVKAEQLRDQMDEIKNSVKNGRALSGFSNFSSIPVNVELSDGERELFIESQTKRDLPATDNHTDFTTTIDTRSESVC